MDLNGISTTTDKKRKVNMDWYRRIAVSAVLCTLVAGCAGYRSFYTTGSNAFHDISIIVSPEVQKVATIENMNINRKQGAGQSFVVSGDISYGHSCRALTINASFINTEGVVLRNTKGSIMDYVANTKARFQTSAYIVAMIGETKDIIDKVVLNSVECL